MIALLIAVPLEQGGRDAGGSGAPPMTGKDPTPYEQFADKLKLDSKQEKDVQQIFTAAAAEAAPVAQEMIQLRQKLLALGSTGKPEERAPMINAHTAAAAKMTGIEVRAFQKVLELLKPDQKSKAPAAFVVMAGLFNPLTPRAGSSTRRGRGGE
jgi:hypothetical protein